MTIDRFETPDNRRVGGWTWSARFEEVYPCSSLFQDSRKMSLKFVVRNIQVPQVYKGWKISFRLHSIHAPFCTHIVNEITKIHRMDQWCCARRNWPVKGMIVTKPFFFSLEKNINVSDLSYQKSVHALIQIPSYSSFE